MGIDGLLRQLKDAVLETHLRRYSGQTVVVDAFSWLHKACYGCAFELATGKDTDAYVRYMLRKVDLLRSCGVGDVILVFDGDRLPLKAATHSKRSDTKRENRELAFQSMADAKRLDGAARQDEISKAYSHFQRAVSITPEVMNTVMHALRQASIRFVVAPFEADAQMVWMCKAGLAQAIVTEDSDVLVYCLAASVDCHVLFKLDDGGMAQALSRQLLHERTASSNNAFLKKIHHLTTGEKDATRMFVQFCALAGCDFLESLPNMGVVTALKHVFNFRGAPGSVRVQRLLNKLASAGTKVPPTFSKQFQQTESIFYHHIVFNSISQTCEFLVDESHPQCHADVFARVKESLGISASNTCLHSLGKEPTPNFLGSVPHREVMIEVFNGVICSRTKQPLSKQVGQSTQPADGSLDATADEFNNDEDEGLVRIDRTRRLPQPKVVVDPVAEERTQLQRTQQRDASMRSLLVTYSAIAEQTSGASRVETRCDLSVELASRVNNAPTRHLRPSKRSVEGVSEGSSQTVLSMKELVQRHAREGLLLTTISYPSNPFARIIQDTPKPTSKTPESAKKRKLTPTKTSTSSKTPLPPGSKTLFNFFGKT